MNELNELNQAKDDGDAPVNIMLLAAVPVLLFVINISTAWLTHLPPPLVHMGPQCTPHAGSSWAELQGKQQSSTD
jgi:hypothetical protein